MNKVIYKLALLVCGAVMAASCERDYVDYVNPYAGNISHLLVPTYPTVQLPNSLLRVYPERKDYTCEYLNGLPVIVTNHRERSAFNLYPCPDGEVIGGGRYNYDNETITPYGFEVELADNTIKAAYALSHQSAVYRIDFDRTTAPAIVLRTADGVMSGEGNHISGYQNLPNDTRVYVYMESETQPESVECTGTAVKMRFAPSCPTLRLRYGVSLISEEQAAANLAREIDDYDLEAVAREGRRVWNETLSRIEVEGSEEDKALFYTSYYRTFERPICISEDGRYFSAWDHQVHEDGGQPFYTDDWIWDTYRAAHPLRSITDSRMQQDVLASFLRMAEQKGDMWMPTFPEVNGDSRRMNSNHGTAVVAEALALGLDADYEALYDICCRAVDEKTLAPWSCAKAGYIDDFYKANGYIPALAPGEKETDPNVDSFEKRQPVAVTLGTAYDQWCLYMMAKSLGRDDDAAMRAAYALDYRTIYNSDTKFFHPKDKDGNFIPDIDYSFCGGLGARECYGENNGWVYRWDVQHNVADLIELMGGNEAFCQELDRTFGEPLKHSKFKFYAMLPDHTGNVGQFSMANEPSLHVPYFYNYAGKPWKTQKRIRQMLDTWFRNDLMGMPGDEDGGGMTSFVVFSMMGFYPVTPGMAAYNIGSPVFPETVLHLADGKEFRIVAHGASQRNKYIQSARLNGKVWDKCWFSYDDIRDGAVLELEMSDKPNMNWAAGKSCSAPSFE